jgi:CxxC-x17-CxxC domain-containing protein
VGISLTDTKALTSHTSPQPQFGANHYAFGAASGTLLAGGKRSVRLGFEYGVAQERTQGGRIGTNYRRKEAIVSYEDRTLTCQDCGADFIFSADDQAYHAEKGYTNEPKRCPSCRAARKSERGGGGGGGGYRQREMHPAVCANCGKDTEVPFLPRGDRPVYCSDCFSKQPSSGRSNY